MIKSAFIGLGVMGGPMAGHLVTAGQDVKVWNRTHAKTEPLAALGATVADSLVEAAMDRDIVFMCVSKADDMLDCLEELVARAKPGTLFVDHSTVSEAAALEAHSRLPERGLRFLDAPITGGSMGALSGQLTVFVGGSRSDFDEAKTAMQPYTKRSELVGGPGKGQVTKMANQIAVAGALLALCESLAFAEKAGLNVALTRELLAGGAAGSWGFENYGPKVVNRDWTPGFSVENQQKDLRYCLEAAQEMGMELPGTELIHRLLGELEKQGRSQDTTAALFDVLVG